MSLDLKMKPCIAMMLGGMILAFGIYNIHSISPVTEGGIIGLVLLCEHWIAVSPAISGFVLNALCYAFGWYVLGKQFITYSSIAGISFSVFYAIFEMFPPVYPEISDYPVAAAFVGALFVGTGVGVAVRFGGAPTGDDAIAMGVSEKTGMDVKWVYLISDSVVLLLSLTYISPEKIFYSFVTVIISGQIISIINGIGKDKRESYKEKAGITKDDRVLIGTTKGPMQLLHAIEHKFYHIPAKRISKDILPVKYVAMYQSLSKFGRDAGIRYYGEVVKCSRIRRNKISEIPKESEALYYRFDVKEWKKLEQSIAPNEKDIVNITTTISALLESRSVTELQLKNENERRIYSVVSSFIEDGIDTLDFGDALVTADGEDITFYKQGRVCFSFTKQEFLSDPVYVAGITANMLYG